jgi:hypothetical protein
VPGKEDVMNITLPDDVRELLKDRARRAGLASVEEYILEAVLAADPEELREVDLETWLRRCLAGDRDPSAVPPEEVEQRWRKIEGELVRGLESGPAIEVTSELWAQRRRVLQERAAQRRRPESAWPSP